VIVGSSILLLYSVVYGPGRGPTLIPADHEHAQSLYFLRITVYALFLVGASASGMRSFLPSVFLAVGLVGRGILETTISVGREWIAHSDSVTTGESVFVLVFYLLSFALPALLCLDSLREWRSRQKLETKKG
jgi:hypothetical protein